MELLNFLKVLLRYKLLLITVPLAAVIITFFLVTNMPNKYLSQSRLATGIVDNTEQMPSAKMLFQDVKANQEFDNIIQMMLLKKIVNQVSYSLIIHDLTSDTPYRKKSDVVEELNPAAKAHALEVYRAKYAKMESLSLWSNDEKGLYSVLESMRYDYESLIKGLRIYRLGSSDFITVEFESENPKLSAYVVNTLCSEFIKYYTYTVRLNHNKTINYLDSMLRYKQYVMDSTMEELKNYKIENHVLNLYEQAKSLYGQIADFETRREMAEKDVAAYGAATRNIDKKFDPNDSRYRESGMIELNGEIESTKEELKELNQAYISSNFNPSYKPQMEALERKLSAQITAASDKYAYNPLTTKQNLVNEKLSLETSRELAANGLDVINGEIDRLHRKLDVLVPNEAEIQAFEQQIDIISREYIELLAKYNAASMESSVALNIRQTEPAMPGTPLPSKKMLLVILSGIISFVFCVAVLFVLFMLDTSIRHAKTLANETQLPVLGQLNKLNGKAIDFTRLWESDADASKHLFRDLLRSVRFELENELAAGEKMVAVTGLLPGEGKTFLTVSLAYAFTHVNKKVLIIDGNFFNPSISQTVSAGQYLEDYLKLGESAGLSGGVLDIMGNKGGDISLLELADNQTLRRRLDELKARYDIILVETSALNTRNVAKEWIMFADKVVGVYEYGKTIGEEVRPEIAYLQSLGTKFTGWVLNKVSDRGESKKITFLTRKEKG